MAKANVAVGVVLNTCAKARLVSWEARVKLNEAIAMNSLLYAVQVWGLRYCDLLEKPQLNFYKCLLSLNRHKPNFVVRLEAGIFHTCFNVLKMTLKWLI